MQHREELVNRRADLLFVVLVNPLDGGVAHVAEEHAADAGAVSREGGVEREVRPQDEVALRVINMCDVVAGAGGEVDRLTGELSKLVDIAGGDLLELLILAALLGEVQQPGAERVFPVFAVLREHAHELQALDDAVDGADGHVHHGRDIRDAKLLPVVLKAVEDVKGLQKRRHIEILIHNEGPPLSDASILAQFFSKFKTLNAQFFSEKVT